MEESFQTKLEWRKAQRALKKAQGHYVMSWSIRRKIRAARNVVTKDRPAASEAKIDQLVAENDELNPRLKRVLAPLDCSAGLLRQPFEPLHRRGTLSSTISPSRAQLPLLEFPTDPSLRGARDDHKTTP